MVTTSTNGTCSNGKEDVQLAHQTAASRLKGGYSLPIVESATNGTRAIGKGTHERSVRLRWVRDDGERRRQAAAHHGLLAVRRRRGGVAEHRLNDEAEVLLRPSEPVGHHLAQLDRHPSAARFAALHFLGRRQRDPSRPHRVQNGRLAVRDAHNLSRRHFINPPDVREAENYYFVDVNPDGGIARVVLPLRTMVTVVVVVVMRVPVVLQVEPEVGLVHLARAHHLLGELEVHGLHASRRPRLGASQRLADVRHCQTGENTELIARLVDE